MNQYSFDNQDDTRFDTMQMTRVSNIMDTYMGIGSRDTSEQCHSPPNFESLYDHQQIRTLLLSPAKAMNQLE